MGPKMYQSFTLESGVVVELTTKGRYAVMAMCDIAQRTSRVGTKAGEDDQAVPLSQVAERQHISLAYLEQLFLKLRRAELVESARGRAGGYRLGRPARAITLSDILAAVAEDTAMTRCGHAIEAPCLAGQRCMTHNLWTALGDHIDAFLDDVTLADVIDGRFGAFGPVKRGVRAGRDGGALPAGGKP